MLDEIGGGEEGSGEESEVFPQHSEGRVAQDALKVSPVEDLKATVVPQAGGRPRHDVSCASAKIQ